MRDMPFTLDIQTEWQKDIMSRHMHMKGVAIDPTFGTNENKVCRNDFHVAFCII